MRNAQGFKKHRIRDTSDAKSIFPIMDFSYMSHMTSSRGFVSKREHVNQGRGRIMSITRITEKDGSLATLTGLITNLVSFPDRPWYLSKK